MFSAHKRGRSLHHSPRGGALVEVNTPTCLLDHGPSHQLRHARLGARVHVADGHAAQVPGSAHTVHEAVAPPLVVSVAAVLVHGPTELLGFVRLCSPILNLGKLRRIATGNCCKNI